MLVARRLGAEGQGAYAAAITFSSLWSASALLGLDAAHTYFLAGRRYRYGEIWTQSIVWTLILSAVTVPLYLWIMPLVQTRETAALGPLLLLSALNIPLSIARQLALALFLGEERMDQFNTLNVLSNLLLLGLLAAILLLGPGDVPAAIVAFLVSQAALLLFAVLWIGSRARELGETHWSWSRPLARESLHYGLRGHAGVFFTQFTYRFDQVLVTRFLGLEPLGFYSIAVLLAEKLSHIPASVQLVLFPRVSGSSVEEANRLTPRACRLTLLLVSAGALVLAALGGPLVRLLYSRDFEPALGSFHALLPGIVALSLAKPLSGDLSGRNRRLGQTLAFASAFLVNLLLDLWWIPRHGIVGAAWASTVAYAWQSAVLVLLFWHATGIGPHALLFPQRDDLSLFRKAVRRLLPGGRA